MNTFSCSNCGRSFYAQTLPPNCPNCGVRFSNYVPPDQFLSDYEIGLIEDAYSNLSYQQQQAVSSSSSVFWNWVSRVASSIWQKVTSAFIQEGVQRFAKALWDMILGG